ncbi:hypothetical protein L596_002182 [Steinernema carpocapsae]|uniref:Uncharacterized protein n=1 Tax=Steinernema carpocapsae TaxID=34508 RepID=A0A4U8UNG5_STECR|nr:hypothetical protein L596_002182 [Steinernema carpocapsae]
MFSSSQNPVGQHRNCIVALRTLFRPKTYVAGALLSLPSLPALLAFLASTRKTKTETKSSAEELLRDSISHRSQNVIFGGVPVAAPSNTLAATSYLRF